RQARDLVHFLVNGDLVDDVLEPDRAALLGEYRERVRIPLDQNLALLDVLAVAHLEARAVDDRVALAHHPLAVADVVRATAVQHDEGLAGAGPVLLPAALDRLQAVVTDRATVAGLDRGLIRDS